MGDVLLRLPSDVYEEIRTHLLPRGQAPEGAGFIFVMPEPQEGGTQVFKYVEWYPVPPGGFVERSSYHLELTDETCATVIKRAHDLEASVVELHSHRGPCPAAFSPDDQRGLREFVPYIWWRLRKRPYFAVVVTEADFDGLAWMVDPKGPQHLGGIVVDGEVLEPTRLSSLGARDERHDRNVRFFGVEGQDRLSAASVAVVGIGGLGTHVVQQLALLGVGRVVLIDDEEVDNSNRNRYIGLRHDDPVPGMPKVALGLRIAREINPNVEVVPICAPLRSQAAFDAVIDCGYVFGCLDNEGARLILNELCLAYAKPYFDLASDILDGGSRYGGRVCFVGNNGGCLVCRGELDTDAARI
ncbi:MAG: ThiF family adenylyltransferase, partial [Chloroflexota bacterium]|nr:ThiF family adenylyltransferase [Chloroflexota bacterium]